MTEKRIPISNKYRLKQISEDPVEFVRCPKCGNEQADMGHGVECENCDYGPMPTKPAEGR